MHILVTGWVLIALHVACNGAPWNLSPVLFADIAKEKYYKVYKRQVPPPTTALPVCTPDQLDKSGSCPGWKAVGLCDRSDPNFIALMRTNCFFTCGNCRLQTTLAPTTLGPSTGMPTRVTSISQGSTTVVTTAAGSTTMALTSESPTTTVPHTQGPTTVASTTARPVTTALSTQGPTTEAPTTIVMTSESPTTMAPTTESPTLAPTTLAPQENLIVTLAVFSGLPDPEWSFSQRHGNYNEIRRLLLAARNTGLTYRPEDMPAKLGNKGFLVNNSVEEQLIVGRETVPLQELLLDTMPRSSLLIPEYFRRGVLEVIRTGDVSAEVSPSIRKRFAPPYLPAQWNADLKQARRRNNCYNYANDKITNTFAQPGRGSGRIFNQLIGNVVRDAAVRDGLVVLNPHPLGTDPVPVAPGGPEHLVALFVDPESCNIPGDFHWYRLDQGGLWSHKPGQTRVKQEDERGKVITDPMKAATARYRFVAFMTSDTAAVTIA